jgi:putative hydrolase of the HAD superfamily
VPDGLPGTLERLRAAGLKLAVVSNANGKVQHLLDRLHLAPYFDVVLDSQVEGVEKPDRRIFEIALERTGARAAETVHVGDLYHVDVEGARGAGLAAVLLDAADLYAGFDCPRIRTIRELPDLLRRVSL